MKEISFLLSGIIISYFLAAQIPKDSSNRQIDAQAIQHWIALGYELGISNDGHFFYYSLVSRQKGGTLIVQSTGSDWRKEFNNVSNGFFTGDSKYFVYRRGDTLYFVGLTSAKSRIITGVTEYQEFPRGTKHIFSEDRKWLVYRTKDEPSSIHLVNLFSGDETAYKDVKNVRYGEKGSSLLIEQAIDSTLNLQLIDLPDKKVHHIYTSTHGSINIMNINKDENQIAFMFTPQGSNPGYSEVWYYKRGWAKALPKITSSSPGFPAGWHFNNSIDFSADGRYIYLKLEKTDLRKPGKDYVNLNIWNYKDDYLQSFQLKTTNIKTYFAAVSTNTSSNYLVSLLNRYESIESYPIKGDWVIVKKDSAGDGDKDYGKTAYEFCLLSLKDGSRHVLETSSPNTQFYMSPEGKYIVYYNSTKSGNLLCYDLIAKRIKRIYPGSAKIFTIKDDIFIQSKDTIESDNNSLVGIAGWLKGDKGLIMYDNHDLWLLDLVGNKSPVNITKDFGRTRNIKFRALVMNEVNVFSDRDSLILAAFNTKTQQTGFYKCGLTGKNTPRLLTMGPYMHYLLYGQAAPHTRDFDISLPPVKAKGDNVWVLSRQSPTEAPNYYLTRDFQTFKRLTTLHPHSGYNWPTVELVAFEQTNGIKSQGILYKPANFDSSKKYPVIINVYKSFSSRLFQFPRPHFTYDGNIDIPWFVSRGYIVFTPDIYFTKGELGPSALHAIDGAVNFLTKYSFINKDKIGLSAHSIGGGLAYYIVTHSNKFAAAFIGAGVSDAVSATLQINNGDGLFGGTARLKMIDLSFGGQSPWDNQHAYISQSPVLLADNITSPILIFHCREDDALPWEQGVEMFLALRYLGKKSWLLEYENGTHYVMGKDAEDLTKRATQYFDHYLKGEYAPNWMTRGVPAKLKGIEDGFELDSTGKCGKICPVCNNLKSMHDID